MEEAATLNGTNFTVSVKLVVIIFDTVASAAEKEGPGRTFLL
jgi:hypothetical protein